MSHTHKPMVNCFQTEAVLHVLVYEASSTTSVAVHELTVSKIHWIGNVGVSVLLNHGNRPMNLISLPLLTVLSTPISTNNMF